MNTMNTGRQQQQMQQQHQNHPFHKPGPAHRDPEQIRRNYRSALSELTFNSKPIITNLTIMAQENQMAAGVIVREIEHQLRNNAPPQKLPVLYLIDSICKNIGGVYITHFARNMVNLFLDAYTLTDPTARGSFEKLLQTWKNGMPGGQPVFSRNVIESIERSISFIREQMTSSRYPHPPHPHSNTPKNKYSSPHTTNSSIHVNPNFIKDQQQRVTMTRDPRMKANAAVPNTSTESSAPAATSAQLLSQLQSMLLPTSQQSTNSPLVNAMGVAPLANNPIPQLIHQIKAILPSLPQAQATSIEQVLSQIVAASPVLPASTLPAVTTASTPSPSLTAATAGLPTSYTIPVVTNSPAAPLVTPSVTTTTTTTTTPTTAIETPTQPPASALSLEAMGPFVLESKDLQRTRPGAIELLYSAEPLQCKQCGLRYPETEKGQAKMDAHLDAHFRQNRKMKERVKRGLSRSWFVSVDEWVRGEGHELTSQQAPTFLHDSQIKKKQNAQANASAADGEEAIDPNAYTVVMPDDIEKKPCPICGERFVDFWNDDEEEWMYKNAILVNDKIFHATCHADGIKSGTFADTGASTEHSQNVSASKRKSIDEGGEEQISQRRRLE